jgi:hypothetical protein
VRQSFASHVMYAVPVFGSMDGTSVWALFKILVVMPVSGLYAWFLTRIMGKYRIPDEVVAQQASPYGHDGKTTADAAGPLRAPEAAYGVRLDQTPGR